MASAKTSSQSSKLCFDKETDYFLLTQAANLILFLYDPKNDLGSLTLRR
jgi:hypothetical protein